MGERHLILDQLVNFALSRHLPAGSSVRSFAGTFDSVTVAPGMRLAQMAAAARCAVSFANANMLFAHEVICTGMHCGLVCWWCRACDAATEKLRKQLLNLDGLPLKVVMVQLLGTVSRRTTPLLPQPSWLAGGGLHEHNGDPLFCRTLQAVEVLATLESSGVYRCLQHSFPDIADCIDSLLHWQLTDVCTQASGRRVRWPCAR